MNRIREIVDIISLKKIVLAVAIFLGGNGLMYFVAIHPFKAAVSQQNEKLKQLTESYIRMKSVDYDKLLQALREQSSLFKEKDSLLQRAVLTEEDIPHFVSKLELEAGAAGLDIVTNVGRPVLVKKAKKKQESNDIVLTLNFTGTYSQMITFLHRLESWSKPVFVNSFHLQKLKGNAEQISGVMRCPILEEKSL